MRVVALVLAAVLLVGCGRSPVAHGSSVASSGRQSSPNPTSVAASSSRESSPPPVAAVSFSCRLPLRTIDGAGTMTGGFIEFPSGNFFADPAGTFSRDRSTGTFRWLSTKQPQLIGSVPLLFYDRAMSRWLPTNRAAVYPDGTRYAYATGWPNQSVHVVDVATGRERTFAAPHPWGAGVFDYSTSGIYLSGVGEAAEVGLWLLNPQTGSERLLSSEKIVGAVGDGKAWLSQLTNSQSGSIFPDTLVELDLASGSKTTWFHRDNANVGLVGLTSAGVPIVSVTSAGVPKVSVPISSGTELWLVPSPGTENRIYSGPNWFDFPSNDSHGIWLSSDGMYLYSNTGGMQKVSNELGFPAGVCV